MRLSANLFAPLSLIAALGTVVVPYEAHGAIVGTVLEGSQLTVNDFGVTNPNAFAVTLNGLAASVTTQNFAGDPTDFVTSVVIAGGTCIPLLGVNLGFAAGARCSVNLTFSTPPADVGEIADFGVSQITLSASAAPGGIGSLLFEVQVNDAPEPGSAALLGLGAGLVGLARWQRIKRRPDIDAGRD